MTEQHPSYLELDRHALGAATQPATVAHVAECARCRHYLASALPAGEPPRWLDASLRPLSAARRTRRWALAGASLAAAAALLLVLLGRGVEESEYDGIKGAPAVGVYVLREGNVRLWDGAPLQSGDRIRLEVAPEQFRRVSVFSLSEGKQPRSLFTGAVTPGARQVLPKAWQIDAAPTPEQLAVFFSDTEISAQAAEVLLRARDPREVWLVQLALPKRTPSEHAP
jgi:hypothetical protein